MVKPVIGFRTLVLRLACLWFGAVLGFQQPVSKSLGFRRLSQPNKQHIYFRMSSDGPQLDDKLKPTESTGSMTEGGIKINWQRGLLQGGLALIVLPFLLNGLPSLGPEATTGTYPIRGDETIMAKKAHGTTQMAVMENLRWGVDRKGADVICSYNRAGAEFAGYWKKTKFLDDTDKIFADNPSAQVTFYDSVTGLPLFVAPQGRTYEDFIAESNVHGWPSFRDEEVVWGNVRSLRDGEMVSLAGTHLGHNLPDRKGNRYCINLVSVAGRPAAAADDGARPGAN
uniref:Uncharacterized protein n=1 Tax=Heterosigma akashiwo TaxID=2829 RepID=A0A7S3Y0D1_HETAK